MIWLQFFADFLGTGVFCIFCSGFFENWERLSRASEALQIPRGSIEPLELFGIRGSTEPLELLGRSPASLSSDTIYRVYRYDTFIALDNSLIVRDSHSSNKYAILANGDISLLFNKHFVCSVHITLLTVLKLANLLQYIPQDLAV
jgi:hypothetical protein